ncbi:DUF3953 domain-containing protein [Psychrobacillus sp. PGGUH221]|uniref:DUF3953 domain-containing protein n=1 Tax=Psychrobacillus sp. PGGUH221 TaxID=3020058 RepID=UPI0035C6CACE
MLKVMKVVLFIYGIGLLIYVWIVDNYNLFPYLLSFSLAMMLVIGVYEIKEKQNTKAIKSFIATIILLFLTVFIFKLQGH